MPGTTLKSVSSTHPLTRDVHDSNHACVLMADILSTCTDTRYLLQTILRHFWIKWLSVKLYSWTFKLYKVVRQQIWGEVGDYNEGIIKNLSTFAKVITKSFVFFMNHNSSGQRLSPFEKKQLSPLSCYNKVYSISNKWTKCRTKLPWHIPGLCSIINAPHGKILKFDGFAMRLVH